MSWWDKLKEYGGDVADAFMDAPIDTVTNIAKVAGSDAGSQLVKGLTGSVLGLDLKQTEEQFSPDVIAAIRTAVRNADDAGRKGTEYEDYPDLPDGTPMGQFVRSSDARKGAANFINMVANVPAAQAAFAVGRGSIEKKDGQVYFTDKYNFSGSSSNKGKDSYSGLRSLVGRAIPEDEGDTTGNTIRIHLGSEEEVFGRKVKKGETLGKIAKDMGVDWMELAAYNNITDPNKLKVGQRLMKPPVQETVQEEVQAPDAIEQAITKQVSAPVQLDDMAYKEYVVQAGDSLSKIANNLGTTVADIVDKNNITNPNMIGVGQRLIV